MKPATTTSTMLAIFMASAAAAAEQEPLPWKVNKPIVTIEKSVFIKCTDPKAAAWCGIGYSGPGLQKYMVTADERQSDVASSPKGTLLVTTRARPEFGSRETATLCKSSRPPRCLGGNQLPSNFFACG